MKVNDLSSNKTSLLWPLVKKKKSAATEKKGNKCNLAGHKNYLNAKRYEKAE